MYLHRVVVSKINCSSYKWGTRYSLNIGIHTGIRQPCLSRDGLCTTGEQGTAWTQGIHTAIGQPCLSRDGPSSSVQLGNKVQLGRSRYTHRYGATQVIPKWTQFLKLLCMTREQLHVCGYTYLTMAALSGHYSYIIHCHTLIYHVQGLWYLRVHA